MNEHAHEKRVEKLPQKVKEGGQSCARVLLYGERPSTASAEATFFSGYSRRGWFFQ
jgi:hypothetical protein